MRSIRSRTAALVAVSMAVLLVAGGVVLLVVLRRAMTAQFDESLVARGGALQSLTHFNGEKVEMDFADEAMPRFSRAGSAARGRSDAEYFIAWVHGNDGWRVLERSESLASGEWPHGGVLEGPTGIRDLRLPDGMSGRGTLQEFTAARERDEDGELRGEPATAAGGEVRGGSAPRVRLLVALSRTPLDRTLGVIAWCIVGVGGVLVLASIVAARWAVRRGLVPLSQLSRRVELLGPETLGERFDSRGLPSELRPIAEQLSGLLTRLEEAFDREKRFAAAASHELRTPLAELRMLLEVAASRPRTAEQWAQTGETAQGVLARAQALCEVLLRLSRAGSGHGVIDSGARAQVGPVLAEQAARAISMHGGAADRVRIQCDPALCACADAAALASIVGNLVENALRHGAATAESPVFIEAIGRDGSVQIEFKNQAPGLVEEDVARLFEPFWRKDASRHDQRGFGLGLAVARTLARACGGEIAARLTDPGMFVVRVTLPGVIPLRGE